MGKQEAGFPAPWHLEGSGVIIFFPAHKANVLASPFVGDAENAAGFQGGVGAVMLVRYTDAPCGPYDELLYIPGFFEFKNRNYLRITKIYVSSPASVEWGRKNWAIPKELAVFDWRQGEKEWHIDVKQPKSGNSIYSLSLSPRFFSFPVTTALLPWSLLQKQEAQYSAGKEFYLETRLSGKGSGKICFIDRVEGSRDFPDYHEMSHGPRIAVAVNNFQMTFPTARVVRA
ncbi:MAG: acetoacetate decarboxylase [Spirochaetes bacterium]|nr:acetoacetate decarboxylase [Spirochaetota bacterium]